MKRTIRLVALVSAVAVAVIGGFAGTSAPSKASSDRGVLQQFAPRSAKTWWAIVESNLHAKVWVVRTTDSGRRWRAVTPSVKLIASASFLGTGVGWIEADSLRLGAPGAPRTEPVYRTLDGGRSWQRLGRVASGCQLDFVDLRHGWCIAIGAAAGSETVRLYRTSDGGSSWSLVSRTGVGDQGSTAGALPFGCDKTLAFSSRRVGWAAQYCNGGGAGLYMSGDGGARWQALATPPLPKGVTLGGGAGLSLPAVQGRRVAVSIDIGPATATGHGTTEIATSANRGRSWRLHLVPGRAGYWRVDLIDVRHWRLSDGTTLLMTNDAGRHWHSLRVTVGMKDSVGTPLMPDFLSARLGFAVPDGNSGPLWWTRNDGTTWERIEITAGPFIVR